MHIFDSIRWISSVCSNLLLMRTLFFSHLLSFLFYIYLVVEYDLFMLSKFLTCFCFFFIYIIMLKPPFHFHSAPPATQQQQPQTHCVPPNNPNTTLPTHTHTQTTCTKITASQSRMGSAKISKQHQPLTQQPPPAWSLLRRIQVDRAWRFGGHGRLQATS